MERLFENDLRYCTVRSRGLVHLCIVYSNGQEMDKTSWAYSIFFLPVRESVTLKFT